MKLNPWNPAALRLIGFEDKPSSSGEITVFEVFGRNIKNRQPAVGQEIKMITDLALEDDFAEMPHDVGVEDWHTLSIDWRRGRTDFFADHQLARSVPQSPEYPMQLMLNLYDLSDDMREDRGFDAFLDVDYVRAYG